MEVPVSRPTVSHPPTTEEQRPTVAVEVPVRRPTVSHPPTTEEQRPTTITSEDSTTPSEAPTAPPVNPPETPTSPVTPPETPTSPVTPPPAPQTPDTTTATANETPDQSPTDSSVSESPPSQDAPSPTNTTENGTISWEHVFYPAATECTIQLYDMNQDGTLDVLAVDGFSMCAVRIFGLDGKTGEPIWMQKVDFEVFAVRCELDVNSDGIMDCLAMGRYSGFVALNGKNGSILWVVDQSVVFFRYNFYFPLIVRDLDGDGVQDLVNMHGGDSTYRSKDTKRSPAFMVVISGRSGQKLMERVLVPDGRESYMSPVLLMLRDGREIVLFGTGGETLPGSLWAVTLGSIQERIQEYARENKDGVEYSIFKEYVNHPCKEDMSWEEIEAMRPVFDTGAYKLDQNVLNNDSFRCDKWGEFEPFWNKYNLCMYELVRTDERGVILPPVVVDMNQDAQDDLVVSRFDGHTLVLDGRDGHVLWEMTIPGTESYRLEGR